MSDIEDIKKEIEEIKKEIEDNKSILASGEGFLLKERNISAYTNFPLIIEPLDKKIIVRTSTGEQFISILPSDALVQVVKGNVLDVIDGDYLILSDGEMGDVQYTVHGKKTLNILNIISHEVPVKAVVSAVDGQVLSVEQPIWLPLASLLFT